jgi:hypothetical protein
VLLAIDTFDIFVLGMKKLKHIAIQSAIILSMLFCFDDSISLFLNVNVNVIEIPASSDYTDINHHHSFSISDHFFQTSIVSASNLELIPDFRLFLIKQSITDQYLSSIWQPPKVNS